MPAFELIGGFVTAAGTTLTEITINTGNSKIVRATVPGTNVRLIDTWANTQAVGFMQFNSPKMHDAISAVKLATGDKNPIPLLPKGIFQKLYPQDQLSIKLAGSATAGDIDNMSALIYYSDLPGSNGHFITAEECASRALNVKTINNSLTMGTSGDWSGEELLNADEDLLKANTQYALMGMVSKTKMCSVRWRGTDFGNLGVGCPGPDSRDDITSDYFANLSRTSGLATIPVFNSANIGSIYIDGQNDENALNAIISTILIELTP